jgi:hypothetical protein
MLAFFYSTKRHPLRATLTLGLLLLLMLTFFGAADVAQAQGCAVSVDGHGSGIVFGSCRERKKGNNQGSTTRLLPASLNAEVEEHVVSEVGRRVQEKIGGMPPISSVLAENSEHSDQGNALKHVMKIKLSRMDDLA